MLHAHETSDLLFSSHTTTLFAFEVYLVYFHPIRRVFSVSLSIDEELTKVFKLK